MRLRFAPTQHTLCAAQRTHTLVMRTSLSSLSLTRCKKKASLAKLAFQVFQNYRLEEQGSEKLGCWKRWETIVRSSTLGGAAENSMCDSDAARAQRWRMWAVHCELLDRFDNHQLHKLTRWDFIRPRVIGITRHEASVPAPSLAAERIHINALRAYGSYRFHGLAFELGFKCYKMRWMRWGQWCGYESSDSDSESDGAMPPLEQQEADPVDLPDLAQ